MSDYEFTQDWFSQNIPVWQELAKHLPDNRAFLEVGSFEGRSAVWMVENMLEAGGRVVCIDTWEGGEEHGAEDMGTVEERFIGNMQRLQAKKDFSLSARQGASAEELADCVAAGEQYDFIYIDGSHVAKDVLTDACMAWPLLKPGGVLVFDDYLWGNPRDILHRPKLAIDAFVNLFAEELNVLHSGYQFAVKKKT
jgi:predicted O-methyltransferase YrrM